MSSDVVLSSALRQNLFSLKQTQTVLDKTQFNLATGRKVNSALDNPQNFFAAQSLNNRASDLSRLLDGIGQNISAIEQANTATEALTTLVEQADAVAGQARDALANGIQEAKVVGNVDLSAVTDLTTLNGVNAGDEIIITVTDPDNEGQNADFGAAAGIQALPNITVAANTSAEELVTLINDNQEEGTGPRIVEARLTAEGFLEIKALNGGDVLINFEGNNAANATADAENLSFAQALGFGGQARLVGQGAANSNNVEVSALATNELVSFALYDNNGGNPEIAERSDALEDLEDVDGNTLLDNLNNANDDFQIGLNGETAVAIETNGQSIQGFIDQINSNSALDGRVTASFDEVTGRISIRAADATVESIEIGFTGNGGDEVFNLGFGAQGDLGGAAAQNFFETVRLGAAAQELAGFEQEFDNIRAQIDQLAADSGFRGTNLLNGDNLVTFFNEDRSSSLTTEGVTFTSAGLGISQANFGRATTVGAAITEVRTALESTRNFGSTLANDLSIIQNRQEFTEKTVENLTSASDKLTIADPNEEGAKLLALQTRQQLGTTSLALASQAQQSVLRLF